MNNSRLLLAALPFLILSVPGCSEDNAARDAAREEPPSLVMSLVEAIPLVPIGVPLTDELGLPEASQFFQSFDVPGATDYIYEVEAGRILVSVLNETIQRVIYQTPMRNDPALQEEKIQRFLSEYGEGKSWTESTEGESAILYQRSDGEVFALWSSEVDYVTVETLEIREVGGE